MNNHFVCSLFVTVYWIFYYMLFDKKMFIYLRVMIYTILNNLMLLCMLNLCIQYVTLVDTKPILLKNTFVKSSTYLFMHYKRMYVLSNSYFMYMFMYVYSCTNFISFVVKLILFSCSKNSLYYLRIYNDYIIY